MNLNKASEEMIPLDQLDIADTPEAVTKKPEAPAYRIEKRPDWLAAPEGLKRAQTDSPMVYLMLDGQTRVEDGRVTTYQRMVVQINDASCIEEMSQYIYEVQPGSQQVLLHGCTIIRGKENIQALDPENIRVIQREASLESHVVTHRVSVVVTLDDVRVGDIISFERSYEEVASDHPLYGNYVREYNYMSCGFNILNRRVRIVNDSSVEMLLHESDSANLINKEDSLPPGEVFEQTKTDIAPSSGFHNGVPREYTPPCLIVTSNRNWADIANHLYTYYDGQSLSSEEMQLPDIDGVNWKITTADSIINIIRFVQDEIRYRSESHGSFTHTPRLPSHVLSKRAGDCKDKSNLMVFLLRQLGVDASVALVDTGLREAVAKFHPSPWLFNHMIVQFVFEGKEYFVDATIKKQGGSLSDQASLRYGVALKIAQDTTKLSVIPYNDRKSVLDVTHHFDLTAKKPTVTLTRMYSQERADNMRYYFDASEMQHLETDYQAGMEAELDVKLSPIKLIHVLEDDTEKNVLVTQESYTIETPLKDIEDGSFTIGTGFWQEYDMPNDTSHPVMADLEGKITHSIVVDYPEKPPVDKDDYSVENKWFSYHDSIRIEGNTLRFSMSLEPKCNRVERKQINACRTDNDKLRGRSASTFPLVVEKPQSFKLMAACWALFLSVILVFSLDGRATLLPFIVMGWASMEIGTALTYWFANKLSSRTATES